MLAEKDITRYSLVTKELNYQYGTKQPENTKNPRPTYVIDLRGREPATVVAEHQGISAKDFINAVTHDDGGNSTLNKCSRFTEEILADSLVQEAMAKYDAKINMHSIVGIYEAIRDFMNKVDLPIVEYTGSQTIYLKDIRNIIIDKSLYPFCNKAIPEPRIICIPGYFGNLLSGEELHKKQFIKAFKKRIRQYIAEDIDPNDALALARSAVYNANEKEFIKDYKKISQLLSSAEIRAIRAQKLFYFITPATRISEVNYREEFESIKCDINNLINKITENHYDVPQNIGTLQRLYKFSQNSPAWNKILEYLYKIELFFVSKFERFEATKDVLEKKLHFLKHLKDTKKCMDNLMEIAQKNLEEVKQRRENIKQYNDNLQDKTAAAQQPEITVVQEIVQKPEEKQKNMDIVHDIKVEVRKNKDGNLVYGIFQSTYGIKLSNGGENNVLKYAMSIKEVIEYLKQGTYHIDFQQFVAPNDNFNLQVVYTDDKEFKARNPKIISEQKFCGNAQEMAEAFKKVTETNTFQQVVNNQNSKQCWML